MKFDINVIKRAKDGVTAGVTDAGELKIENPSGIERASALGDAYVINMADPDPAGGELLLYIKNIDPSRDFVISVIESYSADADVEWILSGTDAVTATGTVITPANLNLGVTKAAALDVRGGAAGVGGCTETTVVYKNWFNGVANTTEYIYLQDSLILPYGTSVAFEYQAGTTNACTLCVRGYFRDKA